MNRKHIVLPLLFSWIVAAFLFLMQVSYVAFDMVYYLQEYDKYQVAEKVSISHEELAFVTESMIQYLSGETEDLNVTVSINGYRRDFFNEKELLHMVDVKNLLSSVLQLKQPLAVLSIAALCYMLFVHKTRLYHIARGFLIGIPMLLATCGIAGLVVSTNFTYFFVLFHKMLFKNQLWQLDERTDLLINIVPEPFFIDMALRIVVCFSFWMICILSVAAAYLWNRKRCGKL